MRALSVHDLSQHTCLTLFLLHTVKSVYCYNEEHMKSQRILAILNIQGDRKALYHFPASISGLIGTQTILYLGLDTVDRNTFLYLT